MKSEHADTVVHNVVIHAQDGNSTTYQALAIKNGKIVELGAERQILNKYNADDWVDGKRRHIYPGLIDAHGHMLSLVEQKLSVDLVGAKSMQELLVKCDRYQQNHQRKVIFGRGWDQSLWKDNILPTNEELNNFFPKTPILLLRIDGHAALANDTMLHLAGINANTKVNGGLVEVENGKLTGLLLDNAIDLARKQVPTYSSEEKIQAMLDVQNELLMYGITGVHEAGIDFEDIAFFKKLIDKHGFVINTYAMLSPTKKNFDFVEKNEIYEHKNLSIRSFKVYADGALGSRGALLKKPYSDKPNQQGLLLTPKEKIKEIADFCLAHNYQMNTHAIGDSANALILELYKEINTIMPDHRWRIEHAQVIDPKDMKKFAEYRVFPSVQPTHAVSDQRWAETRLGKERMQGAYAYKSLLNNFGMIALGTDFPVENINPFLTIHAAVQRKNKENQPSNGFYSQEALTLAECLNGMTIWPAVAAFQEDKLGTLEVGKDATFAIFERPITTSGNFVQNYALTTFIHGEKVYSVE